MAKKTLKDLKPKPVTKAARAARRRLLRSINAVPSGKGLIGGRHWPKPRRAR